MTNLLLVLSCIIFGFGLYLLVRKVLIPRYLLRRHRIAFDVDDNIAFYAVYNVCREVQLGAVYDEVDDNVSIVRFVVPIWKEKKVLGALRAIENVEVY